MFHNLLIDYLFVTSVILIWFMLGYQLVLFLLGFQYSLRVSQEKLALCRMAPTLPHVSIIIPARNEELVIESSLDSILKLDYPKDCLEVLVVNDGSTDNTATRVQKVATLDSRVRLINIPEEKGGRGKAGVLNFALEQASNPVIGVYDADNQPEPQALKYLAEQLVSNDKLGAVIGKFRAINKSENLLLRFLNIEGLSFQWIVQAGRWMLLRVCTLPGTNFLIYKSILQKLEGWDDQALTEDAELTVRLCKAGYQIKFVPYAVTWEQEPRSLSTWIRQRTRWVRGNNYVLRKYLFQLFRFRPKAIGLELFYFISLYYIFFIAIVLSDFLFLFSAVNLIIIPVPGPYRQVWLVAIILFVMEILLTLTREKEEDTLLNFLLVPAMYLTYCQLWIIVVIKGFYADFVQREEMRWAKTERFIVK